MGVLLRLLVLLTVIDCLTAAQGFGEISDIENPYEEKSRFKKFLNLFGIGSSKQFPPPPHHGSEFNPYQYPCAVSTSTTTPAPVVLAPLLCPFPPMVPAQLGQHTGEGPHLPSPNGFDQHQPPHFFPPGGFDPSQQPHLPPPNSLDQNQQPHLPPPNGLDQHHLPPPNGLDQLPPPPPSDSQNHLPPPPNSNNGDLTGSHSSPSPSYPPGNFPHFPFPGGNSHAIFIPIEPGQTPPFPFPGQFIPPYPGQSLPTPPPIQHLPNPVQPGQVPPGGLPNLQAPPSLLPNEDHPLLPSLHHPDKPMQVDPFNPADPVKVNPIPSNPFDPIKVNPTIVNPNDPMQVNPVDIRPTQPVLIDPATIQPGQPLLVDSLHAPPSSSPYLPPPPALNDPKSFTKYPSISPFGPTNVLINPGFPEEPPPQPPTTPQPPTNGQSIPGEPERPTPPFKPLAPPPSPGFLNPGLPMKPPTSLPPPPPGPNTYLINPGIPPENIHLIPLIPLQVLPQRPNFGGGQPPFPFAPPFNPNNPGNLTLPPPPSSLGNNSLPPPPDLYGNKPPLGPPQSVNDPIASPPPIDSLPAPAPGASPLPPPPPPFNVRPFPPGQRGPCGAPFLKPYIPHGFYLSSVNQFIGMLPVPSPQLNFPCPTLDLLQALDFTIMRDLINTSGLLPLFDHTKNYTLFLPSDAAFRRLPKWFRESLEVDPKLKKALLLNHLVKEDLALAMLENEELILSARPGGNRLRINIYEPANTYRAITVDGAAIEKGDILSTNGRLHIVNKVIMPNLPRNAAEFLSEKLEFEGFWNLVKQADMVQNFQDLRPFTLFIPINEAVQRLNDSAFLSDKDKLRNFINYHVVNGTYYSNGLINNEFLLTNYEKEVKLQVASDIFSKTLSGINGKVRVLKADITLTNGVAHVIDQCISEDTPFYVYPQSDEFKNEYGVLRRSFRVNGKEKNIENAYKR